MKVICIVKQFYDRERDKYVKKDDEFEVEDKRAKVLIDRKLVKEVKKETKGVK